TYMNAFKSLHKLLHTSRWRWMIVLSLVQTAVDYIGIAMVFPVVKVATTPDFLEQDTRLARWALDLGIRTTGQLVAALGIGVVVLFVAKFIISYLLNWRVAAIYMQVSHEIPTRLMRKMLRSDY